MVVCLVAIGVGLLYRPLVKPALFASFGWVLVVWWFGEAFGMLFMDMAQPLTGAPGGVLMYALIGLVAWPSGHPGGLLATLRLARAADRDSLAPVRESHRHPEWPEPLHGESAQSHR